MKLIQVRLLHIIRRTFFIEWCAGCTRSLSIWVLFLLQLLLYQRFCDDIFNFAPIGTVPNEAHTVWLILYESYLLIRYTVYRIGVGRSDGDMKWPLDPFLIMMKNRIDSTTKVSLKKKQTPKKQYTKESCQYHVNTVQTIWSAWHHIDDMPVMT